MCVCVCVSVCVCVFLCPIYQQLALFFSAILWIDFHFSIRIMVSNIPRLIFWIIYLVPDQGEIYRIIGREIVFFRV